MCVCVCVCVCLQQLPGKKHCKVTSKEIRGETGKSMLTHHSVTCTQMHRFWHQRERERERKRKKDRQTKKADMRQAHHQLRLCSCLLPAFHHPARQQAPPPCFFGGCSSADRKMFEGFEV